MSGLTLHQATLLDAESGSNDWTVPVRPLDSVKLSNPVERTYSSVVSSTSSLVTRSLRIESCMLARVLVAAVESVTDARMHGVRGDARSNISTPSSAGLACSMWTMSFVDVLSRVGSLPGNSLGRYVGI